MPTESPIKPRQQVERILRTLFSARSALFFDQTDREFSASADAAGQIAGAIFVLAKVSEVLLRPLVRDSDTEPISGTPGYGPLDHQFGFPSPKEHAVLDADQAKRLLLGVADELNGIVGMYITPEMEGIPSGRNADTALLYDLALAQWLLADALIQILPGQQPLDEEPES